MKRVLKILVLLPIAITVVFFGLGMYSQTKTPIGIQNGQLAACPSKPNCVSSESSPSDQHAIAAIELGTKMTDDPLGQLRNIVQSMGGEVLIARDNYLASTFTSQLFRFVDDVEFRIDTGSGLIHVRSASRVGYSDFEANRKRVENIRKQITSQYKND